MAGSLVEIHVPLIDAHNAPELAWINVVEEFLREQETAGLAQAEGGDGEEVLGHYVFDVYAADLDTLLAIASTAATLEGVPVGAFAVVTTCDRNTYGAGEHVPLPITGLQISAAGSPTDWWLHGGVHPSEFSDFADEVDRVIEILSNDESWARWWRSGSASVLETELTVQRLPRNPENTVGAERVRLGKRRSHVRMDIDAATLADVELELQRQQALPAVLKAVQRAAALLRDLPPAPPVPDEALPPAPSAGFLRRQRLRELRAARGW